MAEPTHGVIVAGGRATRMGGAKAQASLGGRPIIHHAIAAVQDAGLPVAVVAKAGTRLPLPAQVMRLNEPDLPVHPLTGIHHALARLDCPVVVCAADMPFVPPGLIQLLAAGDAQAVVVRAGGVAQPLLARYDPSLRPMIEFALQRETSLRALLSSLGDRVRYLDDDVLRRFGDPERITFDIDTPDALAAAHRLLADAPD